MRHDDDHRGWMPWETGSRQRGFSLAEMMVALAITSVLFLAALSMMAVDQRVYNREDAMLEASREARFALEMLERDLLMAGYQVDVRTVADLGADGTANTDDDLVGQPQIAFAAPWEIVFNTDADPAVAAIQDGVAGDTLPSGYAPVTFFTGAETIRYTLDSNGDGAVTAADRGDEFEETAVENPGLFLLRREIYGFSGSDNHNPSGPVALIRGPITYPSGARPTPLFTYWGRFDADAGPDLWGDDGSGGGTANNGILEAGEIAALGPVTGEDANGNDVLDAGEDRNGNGRLDRRPGDLIERVNLHLATEAAYPDMNFVDEQRSGTGTPFRYRVVTLNAEIEPRNVDLPGGACGDEPEPTSSLTITNACGHPLADGKVRLNWNLSADDGANEQDIERYLVFRTDVNSLFGPTPYTETAPGAGSWDDDWTEARTWPPRQYWYRVRAMDCTPHISLGDPSAGPYPADVGPMYPPSFTVSDVPGDDGTSLDVEWTASPDDPVNTTGYGANLKDYHVYRSTLSDYRCQPPVNTSAVAATGAGTYTYRDNATNSTGAVAFGELYHYWLRSRDTADNLSPYSARACARAYRGPVAPSAQQIRVAPYAGDDHPVEIWFSPNPLNEAAGYDPRQIRYRIYRAHDASGDGTADSLVDDPAGYTTADRAATLAPRGTLWAFGDGSGCSQHSIDGGGSWRTLADLPATGVRAADFGDRLTGIAVGDAGIALRTTDGGISFQTAASGVVADLQDVAFLDARRAVAVGDSGTIVVTDDAGASWTVGAAPVAQDLHAVDAVGNELIAVGDGGTVIRSTDGGATWTTAMALPGDDLGAVCALDRGGSLEILAGGEDRIWRSTDGGGSWNAHGLLFGIGRGDVSGLACDESGAIAIVRGGTPKQIYLSTDGTTWLSPLFNPSSPVADVAMLHLDRAAILDEAGRVYMRSGTFSWSSTATTSSCSMRTLALRPEIVWEDATTATAASGRPHHYVVTAAYSTGDPTLDGEWGLLPDRPAAVESPDDSLAQVLVDSCRNFELTAITP
jgi:prepilin-type N-terminal cleavage/methylation domain-containing protein